MHARELTVYFLYENLRAAGETMADREALDFVFAKDE